MHKLRIVLAEDQPIIRQGIRYILDAQPDMHVVAEASDGQQVLHTVRTTQPDIVLMDIRLPLLNGIEATSALLQTLPNLKVVLLTTYDLQEYVIAGIRAGAVGYLLKDSTTSVLLDGIRAAAHGAIVYHSTSSAASLHTLTHTPPTTAHDISNTSGTLPSNLISGPQEPLTEREHEILQQMAFGHRNVDIARILSISEGTVKSHVHRIIQKLGVQDRTQAVVLALRQHLVH
jgi:DNA-binding NarL/FixJ family response regulator